MEQKQYYKILGVPRDASAKDIKKAYQLLAKKYNPAKNPGNEEWAEKRKSELVEAYDALINPAIRAQYDAVLAEQTAIVIPAPTTVTASGLPVKPARVRPQQKNKLARTAKDDIDPKVKKELEAKKRRRNTIFTVSGIAVAVTIVALIFYLIVYVLPFQKVVIRVDNESVKIDYLIRRVMMNSQGTTWDTLQAVVNERILSQEVPKVIGDVTPEDVDALMRATAQGDKETLTELEYSDWLRQQLNLSQLNEAQFRELFRVTLLQSRMYSHVAGQVSNMVPQIHLNYIVVKTYEEAEAAKARIDGGEDFAVIAKELSIDTTSAEKGGDVGWTPVELLQSNIKSSIVDLEIGVCSIPIALESSTDTTTVDAASYALVLISEKTEAMEATEDQLQGLRDYAFDQWMLQYQSSKTITFHGINNQYLDSETFSWISYQVDRLRKTIDYGTTDTTDTTDTSAGE